MKKQRQSSFGGCLSTILLSFLLCACESGDGITDPNPKWLEAEIPAVSIRGSGTNRVTGFALDGGHGSLVLGSDTIPAMAYEFTEWPEYGLSMFHVIAPEEGTLNVAYIYTNGTRVSYIFHQDFTLPLRSEPASGHLTSFAGTARQTGPLHQLLSVPGPTQWVLGIEISGPQITFRDGTGSLLLKGDSLSIYSFELVDCSNCESGDSQGWLEIHALLKDQEGSHYFGILYLFEGDAGSVTLGYGICLDTLERMDDISLLADWKTTKGSLHAWVEDTSPVVVSRMPRPVPHLVEVGGRPVP